MGLLILVAPFLSKKGGNILDLYKKEKIGMLVILVIFIAAFLNALTFPKMEIRIWPLFVEGMGILVTLIYLSSVIVKERRNIPIQTPKKLDKETLLVAVKSLSFFIVYAVSARYIGFITMTFIACVLFAYWLSPNDKKWKYIAFSAGVTLAVFLGFELFLGIPLPKGLLI